MTLGFLLLGSTAYSIGYAAGQILLVIVVAALAISYVRRRRTDRDES